MYDSVGSFKKALRTFLLKKLRLISLACVSSETHNLPRVFRPGGVVSYIGYIGMRAPKGMFFFSRVGFLTSFFNKLSINVVGRECYSVN